MGTWKVIIKKDPHKFWGFCSGITEDSILLGHEATSPDDQILAFEGKTVPSPSRVKMFKKRQFNPWRQWQYVPSKHCNLIIQSCSIASQNRILKDPQKWKCCI